MLRPILQAFTGHLKEHPMFAGLTGRADLPEDLDYPCSVEGYTAADEPACLGLMADQPEIVNFLRQGPGGLPPALFPHQNVGPDLVFKLNFSLPLRIYFGFLRSSNSRAGACPRSEAACSPSCNHLTFIPRIEQLLWRRRLQHQRGVAEQRG